jgi:hypothetical protein
MYNKPALEKFIDMSRSADIDIEKLLKDVELFSNCFILHSRALSPCLTISIEVSFFLLNPLT